MLILAILSYQAFIVGVVAFGLGYIVYWRFLHSLSDIPGPFLASISHFWLAHRVIRGDILAHLTALHRKHGPLVRIAPNEISAVDAVAMKQIYGHAGGFSKSEFYNAFGNPDAPDVERDVFSQRNEQKHASKRRLLSKIYSMSSILKSEMYLDECLHEFLAVLDRSASDGAVLDLGANCHRYTFDSIGIFFFGQPFGFLRRQEDIDGMIETVMYRTKHRAFFAVIPWLNKFAQMLELIVPALRVARQQTRRIIERAEVCVQGRLDQPSPRQDILATLVSLHKAQPTKFTHGEVVTEAFSAISAGNDSTATALRSIFYHLLKNPRCMAELIREIDAHETRGQFGELVLYKEAMELPYLAAVIKEGMRMFPSVGLTIPRIVPNGGIEIAGKFIPEKTVVGMSAHVVHFDHEIFGSDADSFVPERWLRNDAANMERCFFEFGGGSRTCIGKNIALCEIYRLIPNVLRRFSVELVDPTKDWKTTCGWFAGQDDILVKVVRRHTASDI